MNSLIEVIKISNALNAKRSAGRNSLRLKRILCQTLPTRGIEGKDTYDFSPPFSRLFFFLSSRILQNNLLDLLLVEIRR